MLQIRNRTELLKSHNYAGRLVPEMQDESVREIIEGHYRIIYSVVNEGRIDILTVHHATRDLLKRDI